MRARDGLTVWIALTLVAWGAAAATSPVELDFDALKSLEGEWVRLGDDGEATDEVTSRWEITAAGTAVVETLFPGTEKEMVTVYHRDGDDLVLTHYCIAGNAPRMRAKPAGAGRLEFRCEGGANLASEHEDHMHSAVLEWVDDDHIRAEWVMLEDGKPGHTAKFDLVRRR
jgi:hypothetical protein